MSIVNKNINILITLSLTIEFFLTDQYVSPNEGTIIRSREHK